MDKHYILNSLEMEYLLDNLTQALNHLAPVQLKVDIDNKLQKASDHILLAVGALHMKKMGEGYDGV